MIQTSCSELLVDTAIHDPEQAYATFKEIFEKCSLETSPPLSIEMMKEIKRKKEEGERSGVLAYDAQGNRCALEYGDNSYIETLGYRFDSHCDDYNERCYPIFQKIIQEAHGQLYSCDGGHKDGYEEWEAKSNRS